MLGMVPFFKNKHKLFFETTLNKLTFIRFHNILDFINNLISFLEQNIYYFILMFCEV